MRELLCRMQICKREVDVEICTHFIGTEDKLRNQTLLKAKRPEQIKIDRIV